VGEAWKMFEISGQL